MIVNLSLVLVLAVAVWLLVTRGGLKATHALACVLLGFYLARSSLAPTINRLVADVVDALGRISF